MAESLSPTTREVDVSNPLTSFVDTTIGVLRQPTRFFAQLPTHAGYLNPFVYSLICTVIETALTLLAFDVLNLPSIGSLSTLTEAPPELGRAVTALLNMIMVPVSILVGAAIAHIAVGIVLRWENAGFQATYRVLAYSSALLLFDWLPLIGWVFALYSIYVTVVGIREVHRATAGQAIGIMLLPLVLLVPLLLCFVLSLLAG